MSFMCYDIMELVGREVARCREEILNRRCYNRVVYVMRDVMRETRDSATQRLQLRQTVTRWRARPPRTLNDEHDNRFVEDFKQLLFINMVKRDSSEYLDFLDPTWGWSGAVGTFSYTDQDVRIPNDTMSRIQVELYGDDDDDY